MIEVLYKVIGECPHVFMEGRQIIDVVLVANEVVDNRFFGKENGFYASLI